MTSSADLARRRSSVVCGLDHSEHAGVIAEAATVLAERLGLRLVFVHAVPASVPPLAPVWPRHAPENRDDIRRRAVDQGWRLVQRFVVASGMTDAVGRVETGLPAECLLGLADVEAADFVVLGTRGEGAVRATLMGSTSLATTQSSVCPVVVVPLETEHLGGGALVGAQAVLCGVAAREDREPLRVALRLADAFELPLLPAHVVEHPDDSFGVDAGARRDQLLAEVLATSPPSGPTATRRGGTHALAAVQDAVLRAGDPADQLARLAAETRAGLVVVGTHARGPLRSALLGSVSRSLARRSAVPVVICPRAAAR